MRLPFWKLALTAFVMVVTQTVLVLIWQAPPKPCTCICRDEVHPGTSQSRP